MSFLSPGTALSLAVAVGPPVLLAWLVWSRELHPEPRRVVGAAFGFGALSALPVGPAAVVALALFGGLTHPVAVGLGLGFLGGAAPEEVGKFTVLVLYCVPHREFDEPVDGLVYGVVVALGFATLENIFYVLGAGWQVGVFRAFTSIPLHAALGAIMGAYVGRARFDPARGRLPLAVGPTLKGLGAAILLHGLYDSPLFTLLVLLRARGAAEDAGAVTRADPALVVGLILLSLLALVLAVGWALALFRTFREEQRRAAARASPSSPWAGAGGVR